jgi:hypothetical protein
MRSVQGAQKSPPCAIAQRGAIPSGHHRKEEVDDQYVLGGIYAARAFVLFSLRRGNAPRLSLPHAQQPPGRKALFHLRRSLVLVSCQKSPEDPCCALRVKYQLPRQPFPWPRGQRGRSALILPCRGGRRGPARGRLLRCPLEKWLWVLPVELHAFECCNEVHGCARLLGARICQAGPTLGHRFLRRLYLSRLRG